MFSCDASGGDFIVWRVNGTGFKDLSSEILSDLDINPVGISSGLSTLNITARAVYNGTTVQCVTGDIGGVAARSENVTLTIQGVIAINDITCMCHINMMLFAWGNTVILGLLT